MVKTQCKTVQFRDHAITESNEDSNFDKMGSFYGSIVNLNVQHTSPSNNSSDEKVSNMNETVVIETLKTASNDTLMSEDQSDLIISMISDDKEEPLEEEEEEDNDESPVRWRPPTPPKVLESSLKNNSELEPITEASESSPDSGKETETENLTEPVQNFLIKSVLNQSGKTPTPPHLNYIESKSLFKPVVSDLNTTYDFHESPADNEVNETVIIDKNDHDEKVGDSTFVMDSEKVAKLEPRKSLFSPITNHDSLEASPLLPQKWAKSPNFSKSTILNSISKSPNLSIAPVFKSLSPQFEAQSPKLQPEGLELQPESPNLQESFSPNKIHLVQNDDSNSDINEQDGSYTEFLSQKSQNLEILPEAEEGLNATVVISKTEDNFNSTVVLEKHDENTNPNATVVIEEKNEMKSPSLNDGVRKINPAKIAKVSPMVPEKSKGKCDEILIFRYFQN